MPKPIISAIAPAKVEVKTGEKVFFCTCGHSAKQPFCDGAHKGTGFACMPFTPEKDGAVFFCTCKHSAKMPFCDGTHKCFTPDHVGTEGPEAGTAE